MAFHHIPEEDLKNLLKHLSTRPGVYQMLDENRVILYVGKARNLRRRVSSYFQRNRHAPKTLAMLSHVHRVEVTVTHTETEALVLEANLIKQHRPRYNVLLRDDKSYPYLYLDTSHPFPRLAFHRGAKKGKGRYFGPYPSSFSVRETLALLQKTFPIRQCEDSVFSNRSRPCLQYQIKRCTGPCVDLVSKEAYAEDVANTVRFLEGRTSELSGILAKEMQHASDQLEFERAARFRDQIQALAKVQEKQYVNHSDGGDFDIIACHREDKAVAMYVSFIRSGRSLGGRAYFPKHAEGLPEADVMAGFLPLFYLDRPPAGHVLVSHMPRAPGWLKGILHSAQLSVPTRGPRKRWLDMAMFNCQDALRRRLAAQASFQARCDAIGEALTMAAAPERIECFDISHSHGEATVASCVVFDSEGPRKSDYRRYNIRGVAPGDDYGAMREALQRRFSRKEGDGRKRKGALEEGKGEDAVALSLEVSEDPILPDILLIDGGKGQLNAAIGVLADLGIDGVLLVGVAKGEGRKPGLEVLHVAGGSEPVRLPADSIALHGIQQVRDEAHRFAITGHRARRDKARKGSTLDDIPGVGPKRRKALIQAFGGAKGVQDAGVDDLCRVEGVSRNLAEKIYGFFHSDGRGEGEREG